MSSQRHRLNAISLLSFLLALSPSLSLSQKIESSFNVPRCPPGPGNGCRYQISPVVQWNYTTTTITDAEQTKAISEKYAPHPVTIITTDGDPAASPEAVVYTPPEGDAVTVPYPTQYVLASAGCGESGDKKTEGVIDAAGALVTARCRAVGGSADVVAITVVAKVEAAAPSSTSSTNTSPESSSSPSPTISSEEVPSDTPTPTESEPESESASASSTSTDDGGAGDDDDDDGGVIVTSTIESSASEEPTPTPSETEADVPTSTSSRSRTGRPNTRIRDITRTRVRTVTPTQNEPEPTTITQVETQTATVTKPGNPGDDDDDDDDDDNEPNPNPGGGSSDQTVITRTRTRSRPPRTTRIRQTLTRIVSIISHTSIIVVTNSDGAATTSTVQVPVVQSTTTTILVQGTDGSVITSAIVIPAVTHSTTLTSVITDSDGAVQTTTVVAPATGKGPGGIQIVERTTTVAFTDSNGETTSVTTYTLPVQTGEVRMITSTFIFTDEYGKRSTSYFTMPDYGPYTYTSMVVYTDDSGARQTKGYVLMDNGNGVSTSTISPKLQTAAAVALIKKRPRLVTVGLVVCFVVVAG